MTTSIKVKVVRKPVLKVKVLPRFPASVVVESPILLDRTGGNYTFELDLNALAADLETVFAPIAFPDGSAAAPSITFASDFDTGLYRIGSNEIGVSVGGSKVLDIALAQISASSLVNAKAGLSINTAPFSATPEGYTNPGNLWFSATAAAQNATLVEVGGQVGITSSVGLASGAEKVGFTAYALGAAGSGPIVGLQTIGYGVGGAGGYNVWGLRTSVANNGANDSSFDTTAVHGHMVISEGSANATSAITLIGTLAKFYYGYSIVGDSIVTASYFDASHSPTLLQDTGTHTTGIDLSGGTYSGSPFKSTGFSIDHLGSATVLNTKWAGSGAAAGPSAYLSSNVLTFSGGTNGYVWANQGLSATLASLSNTGAFALPTYTTAGTLVNDTSGNVTTSKVILTNPASAATLTLGSGKTATVSNTLTFTGTDGSSVAFGSGGTVLYANQTVTLSGAITGSGTTAITTSLGSFTSANLASALTDETGTGAAVFGTTPTLATPIINGLPTGTGVATANTVSTLVARDGSGSFSAGTVTASLTGHASLDLALTGGTMSGVLAMGANNITGTGTVNGGTITSTGNVNAGVTFQLTGSGAMTGTATYTQFVDPSGNNCVSFGGTGDPTNYFSNTSHQFYNRASSVHFATIDANGILADLFIKSKSPTAGIGYATGAGGTVTQITSRTTSVTLNTVCGAITLFAAAPAVGTWVSFTVTNSAVVATDVPKVAVKSGTNTYIAHVTTVAAGSFQISITSIVGTTSDSPAINFAIDKAVTS